MPTVFRSGSFRFFFYSNEGSPRERTHIHVERGDHEAKVWVNPGVAIAYNDGFDARTLRELLSLVEANRERIEVEWNNFFRGSDERQV
ncbi:MAG TPA: DUF4160 domain-containing protein [Stellaceae bacterium]|nr:DUF4160 domain-containing protein [Stellaceae bacterium]